MPRILHSLARERRPGLLLILLLLSLLPASQDDESGKSKFRKSLHRLRHYELPPWLSSEYASLSFGEGFS